MRLPVPPDGDRFFSRLLSVLLECPACGYLDAFRWRQLTGRSVRRAKARREGPPLPPRDRSTAGDPARKASERARVRREKQSGWDPSTGCWRCPQCHRRFLLGLLAWPIARGGHEVSRPRDQVPSERELTQLRARNLGGLWLPESLRQAKRRAEHSNITARCSCKPGCAYTDQRDKGCPLHGDAVDVGEDVDVDVDKDKETEKS